MAIPKFKKGDTVFHNSESAKPPSRRKFYTVLERAISPKLSFNTLRERNLYYAQIPEDEIWYVVERDMAKVPDEKIYREDCLTLFVPKSPSKTSRP